MPHCLSRFRPLPLLVCIWLFTALPVRAADTATTLMNQGEQAFARTDLEQAGTAWQQALFLYRQQHNRTGEGLALCQLSRLERNRSHYPEAFKYAQQALRLGRTIGDRRVQMLAHLGLGNVRNASGQFREAMAELRPIVALARSMKDRFTEAKALNSLAISYYSLGDLPAAEKYFKQSLKLMHDLKERRAEVGILNNLANIFYSRNDFVSALEMYCRTLKLAESEQSLSDIAVAESNLGSTYAYLGDYSRAIRLQQRPLEIAHRIGSQKMESRVYSALGQAYLAIGDLPKAIEYYQKDVDLAKQLADVQEEGEASGDLAVAYRLQGDLTHALEYQQRSIDLAHRVGDQRIESAAYTELAVLYLELGQSQQAHTAVLRGLTLARSIGDRQVESEGLSALAAIEVSDGQLPAALVHQHQAVVIAVQNGDASGTANARIRYAQMLELAGRRSEALATYLFTVRQLEQLRGRLTNDRSKRIFQNKWQSAHFGAIDLLLAEGRGEEALVVSEQLRARALVDLLASRLLTPRPDTAAQEWKLRQLLATAPTQVQVHSHTQAVRGVVAALNRKAPEVASLYAVPPSTLSALRAQTHRRRRWIAEYLLLPARQNRPERLVLWIIPPDGPIRVFQSDLAAFAQRNGQSLAAYIADTRTALTNHRESTPRLQTLGTLLAAPIVNTIPKGERLILVPNLDLYGVPFAALVVSKTNQSLIDNYVLSFAPSIQTLQFTGQLTSQKRLKAPPLIVGNPQPPTDRSWENLSGADREADQIALLTNSKALHGAAASEAQIKRLAPAAGLLHFAAHGLLDSSEPLSSAIVLSPGEGEDGYLSAAEVFSLHLKAQLVVIAACNSLGSSFSSEGAIGLARAFIGAGVPSLILSQWTIADAPTAEFMQEFYTQLRTQKDKAAALRTAMLTVRTRNPDPSIWAGFVLIGEP